MVGGIELQHPPESLFGSAELGSEQVSPAQQELHAWFVGIDVEHRFECPQRLPGTALIDQALGPAKRFHGPVGRHSPNQGTCETGLTRPTSGRWCDARESTATERVSADRLKVFGTP